GAAELGHGEMTLDDELESGRKFAAPTTKSVCLPAILNEEGSIIDSGTALVSMALKPTDGGTSPLQLGVSVQSLGPVYLDADRPERLLIPAAVDESAPVPAPNEAAHALDRYKCYRARQSKDLPHDFPRSVKLRGQEAFEDAFYDFTRPSRLCNPVAVDGSSIKNTAGKLLCYLVRLSREQPHHVPRNGLHVATAFG